MLVCVLGCNTTKLDHHFLLGLNHTAVLGLVGSNLLLCAVNALLQPPHFLVDVLVAGHMMCERRPDK